MCQCRKCGNVKDCVTAKDFPSDEEGTTHIFLDSCDKCKMQKGKAESKIIQQDNLKPSPAISNDKPSTELEVGDVINELYRLDWIDIFRTAYESRKMSWNELGNIREWRNATDEVCGAVIQAMRKRFDVEEPISKAVREMKQLQDSISHTDVEKIRDELKNEVKRKFEWVGKVPDEWGKQYRSVQQSIDKAFDKVLKR